MAGTRRKAIARKVARTKNVKLKGVKPHRTPHSKKGHGHHSGHTSHHLSSRGAGRSTAGSKRSH